MFLTMRVTRLGVGTSLLAVAPPIVLAMVVPPLRSTLRSSLTPKLPLLLLLLLLFFLLKGRPLPPVLTRRHRSVVQLMLGRRVEECSPFTGPAPLCSQSWHWVSSYLHLHNTSYAAQRLESNVTKNTVFAAGSSDMILIFNSDLWRSFAKVDVIWRVEVLDPELDNLHS